ncbi:ribbon-helix-helix protein, CopG family [Reinekea blandensis]|uniref:Ribbon-helix-helix protein CopG domain-containing protein n=1 Tax=Reinekea blandensis MED297 TaxID=314283 RepID=A4BJW0_9GAMM|nr:ribbon-helix-helix protein, CopG family [Reinekea blandensis]EAR07561.1 hypothetical protein MED297_00030 [Reinekea sp. MED297] [Reinekea blandensis MED297]
MPDVKKATFNLPVEELEALKALAAEEHKSVTEILRRAIKAEMFLTDTYKQGSKVLIETKDHEMREVIRA